ncbi:hypothetical protein [Erwinia aphidicola]|uniref:hypothetical protein n=1 Tax=Erwinia aphidicola TaxID=68334 RepID=UPI0030CF2DDB
MIALNIGTCSFSMTSEEAVYVAENLLAAAAEKTGDFPAFNSSVHGHICVRTERQKPEAVNGAKETTTFRSNPQQSDHVLTDC